MASYGIKTDARLNLWGFTCNQPQLCYMLGVLILETPARRDLLHAVVSWRHPSARRLGTARAAGCIRS